MENKVFIEEVSGLDNVEYDIVTEGDGETATLARCWDYLLAERIRDTVEGYMKGDYKITSEEEN